MDNMLNRSAQTGPPNVRKRRPVFPPAGRSVVLCTPQMAPRTSFLLDNLGLYRRRPPPFQQTCSEVGGREGWVQSQNVNKPPKGSTSQFYYVHVENVYTMYIYTNLLNLRATCGSAEQPLPSPIGKALSQPKPHPSDRTVWGYYVTSVAGWQDWI